MLERIIYPAGSQPAFDFKPAALRTLAAGLAVTLLKAALVIILAAVIKRAGTWIIRNTFKKRRLSGVSACRVNTLSSLLCSIYKYTVYFFAVIFFLQFVLGFNAMATVATISVSGIAVGLAAQGIIRDLLAGIFILVENQFAVGEKVSIKEKTGIVEELGLRVTRLRGQDGEIHVIPNGEIGIVTNFSRKGEKDAPPS